MSSPLNKFDKIVLLYFNCLGSKVTFVDTHSNNILIHFSNQYSSIDHAVCMPSIAYTFLQQCAAFLSITLSDMCILLHELQDYLKPYRYSTMKAPKGALRRNASKWPEVSYVNTFAELSAWTQMPWRGLSWLSFYYEPMTLVTLGNGLQEYKSCIFFPLA